MQNKFRWLSVAIFYAISVSAQTESAKTVFATPEFVNDSLILRGGVGSDEYFFPLLDNKTLDDYSTFGMLDIDTEKSKRAFVHWETPILYYLDKSIPRELKKDFRKFLRTFPHVENLSIREVRSLARANYKITATTDTISVSGSFDNAFFSGITYNLANDVMGNCTSGVLSINLSQISDPEIRRARLRQFFFNSLGIFVILESFENDECSLFSTKYVPQDTLSEMDLNVLRCHYQLTNKNVMFADTFRKLRRKARKIENENQKLVKLKI